MPVRWEGRILWKSFRTIQMIKGVASSEGKRWARNIQHLMREEAGLHRVFDPMGGSRVVEAWTVSLVDGLGCL